MNRVTRTQQMISLPCHVTISRDRASLHFAACHKQIPSLVRVLGGCVATFSADDHLIVFLLKGKRFPRRHQQGEIYRAHAVIFIRGANDAVDASSLLSVCASQHSVPGIETPLLWVTGLVERCTFTLFDTARHCGV